jgi:hypothetical protein
MHNFLKTLHGFLQCREKESVTVREFTRLASWSARYSAVCRSLKPFTKDLFNAIRGRTVMNATFLPDEIAVRAVWLWRSYLITWELKGSADARPIASMAPGPPTYVIEYDASLSGVGLVISTLVEGELQLLKVAKVVFPYDLGVDSGLQNTWNSSLW